MFSPIPRITLHLSRFLRVVSLPALRHLTALPVFASSPALSRIAVASRSASRPVGRGASSGLDRVRAT